MARTQLLAGIRRHMAAARLQLGDASPVLPRAISRRSALALLAAVAACSPESEDAPAADTSTVAIVGGGLSGLVTAWRLAVAGIACDVFEASGRFGGRVNTLRDFTPEGQFCELGGEFIDTDDAALIRLCGELGVALETVRVEGDGRSALYDIGGKIYTDADLLDPVAQTGAFIPAAARIAADQAALLDAAGDWTERARRLDALPLSDYLDSLRSTTEAWVVDLLALAWQIEFGIPVARQSSLNLVDMIGANSAKQLNLFSRRRRTQRVAGGSSTLAEALVERLGASPLSDRVNLNLRHELTAIDREANGVRLDFRTEQGPPVERVYSRVVMALPFTKLREVKGLGGLALPADKMAAINELGYGAHARLAVGTSSRPWSEGVAGAATARSGVIYSDRGFQLVSDTSVGQAGVGGVLTNTIAGDGARGEEARALARLEAGLAALAPDIARALTPKVRASFFWPAHPYTKGSYAGCLAGQYTRVPEIAARAELGGAMVFAGEHASIGALGTMNGAVDAGERAAKLLLTPVEAGERS